MSVVMNELRPQDIAVFCGLALLVLGTWRYVFCPLAHLPGPWYTRLTGAVDFIQTLQGRRALAIDDLHRKYGPVVRIAPSMASVWGQDAIKTIYGSSKNRAFDKDKLSSLIFNFRGPKYANLVGLSNSREAAQRRRFYGSAFSRGSLLNIYGTIEKALIRYDERLRDWTSKNAKIDFSLASRIAALDVITEVAFGGHYKGGTDGLKLMRLLDDFGTANVLRVSSPVLYKLLKLVPLASLKWVHSLDGFCDIGEKSVDEYLAHRKDGQRAKDVMGPLIEYRDENGTSLDREQLNIEALQMIVGGTDTTSNTTSYISWEVARNPTIYNQLRSEVSKVKGESPSVVELEQLPYLTACIYEGLRLHCALPGPTPRVVPQTGAHIVGQYFPAGTEVFVQAQTAHQDASLFPNPQVYDPSRWLNNKNEAEMHKAMMGFSSGPRICLGMTLAWIEMRYMIAQLFRNYEVQISPDNHMDDKAEFLLISPRDGHCYFNLAAVAR